MYEENKENGYQYTSNGTGQYEHYQIPQPEEMTRQQKKAQEKVAKVMKKAEEKRLKAERRQAKKEQRKSKNHYPFGKRVLASVVCGVLFAATAFGTFYGVEQFTGLTIFTGNSEQAGTSQQDIALTDTLMQETSQIENMPVINGSATADTNGTSVIATDVTQVVQNVMPSIVSIVNQYTQNITYWGQNYSQEGTASGSGIIVGMKDQELLIATNYHVIEGATQLDITFIDETTATADVKGTDAENDLAIVAVQLDKLSDSTKKAIAIARLGDSDALQVGEPVIAIGNALGYGQSVTTGVVSALDRQLEDVSGTMIQTDAAINPGNSGGALLNAKGEVIGINSAKIGGNQVEGMGYAIPISTAEPILEELMAQTTKIKVEDEQKGYIGIAGVNVTSSVSQMYGIPEGVYVYQVYTGTAAETAGIRQGDVITAINGASVGSMEELQRELQYYAIGTEVKLTVKRAANGYEEEQVSLVLGEKFEG